MFYNRFKELCDKRGISCNRAANEMGLSNATPTAWKKRGLTPKADTLAIIAAYFNVTTDYLLGQETENAPADNGKRTVTDDDIMFALWGDTTDVNKDDLDDVKRYAAFVRERKRKK